MVIKKHTKGRYNFCIIIRHKTVPAEPKIKGHLCIYTYKFKGASWTPEKWSKGRSVRARLVCNSFKNSTNIFRKKTHFCFVKIPLKNYTRLIDYHLINLLNNYCINNFLIKKIYRSKKMSVKF